MLSAAFSHMRQLRSFALFGVVSTFALPVTEFPTAPREQVFGTLATRALGAALICAAPADESAESAALGASVAMPAEVADDESEPQSAEVVPLHSGGSQQQP